MASQGYNNAIIGNTRRTSTKITFGLIDVTAKDDASYNCTDEENEVSRKNQVINNISEPTNLKFTTLERGYFKLDGSNVLTPKTTECLNLELGYWSHNLSNSNKEFDTPPIFVFNFSIPHSSIGLTLCFDNEYPTEIQFNYYDINDDLISTITLSNNDTTLIVSNPVLNYSKIEIIFLKTLNAYRRVRFSQITFGIIQTYEDKILINAKLVRELELIKNNTPTSDVSFTINNMDRKFNILNANGIYKYLQNKQKISVEMGVYTTDTDIEFINVGSYYLNEWKTSDITASFVAKDILFFTEDINYTCTIQTKTFKEFAILLLSAIGISNCDIDDTLDNIVVTTGFTDVSIKKLIHNLCVASTSLIFVNRDDTVVIKHIPTTRTNTIRLDDMFKLPTIELDDEINTVYVDVFDPITGTSTNTIMVTNAGVGDEEKAYKISNNQFITTDIIATNVANYYLDILSKRAKYKINWRENPDIDIADKVKIYDGFDENKDIIITKQELTYNGYLTGTSEGRGIY